MLVETRGLAGSTGNHGAVVRLDGDGKDSSEGQANPRQMRASLVIGVGPDQQGMNEFRGGNERNRHREPCQEPAMNESAGRALCSRGQATGMQVSAPPTPELAGHHRLTRRNLDLAWALPSRGQTKQPTAVSCFRRGRGRWAAPSTAREDCVMLFNFDAEGVGQEGERREAKMGDARWEMGDARCQSLSAEKGARVNTYTWATARLSCM